MDLYRRGAETLVASWEAYAASAQGAAVVRSPGVACAVFPDEPERSVYNNALPERHLPAGERASAIAAMEAAYAGVGRFAAWVHESDAPLRADLEARGYTLDTATRAMGMTTAELRAAPIEVAPGAWDAYLDFLWADDVPHGLLAGVDPGAFHVLLAGADAAGIAFDRDGDCGIFNVSTRPHARGRGLGTALTARLVRDAADRGCVTASLQATAIAENVYRAVGFRDLGLILEYVP